MWGEVGRDEEEEGMGVTVVLRPSQGRESMKLTMLSSPPLDPSELGSWEHAVTCGNAADLGITAKTAIFTFTTT